MWTAPLFTGRWRSWKPMGWWLVQASGQNPKAGRERRVYRVTPLGERALRAWMGVIKQERDCLNTVLRRYQATGTADAVLAEVEGGWSADLGFGWSPVSSTSAGLRRLALVDLESEPATLEPATLDPAAVTAEIFDELSGPRPQRFRLVADRSVVLIEVRSTVGPLSFGAIGVRGWIDAAVANGVLQTTVAPSAHIEIDLSGLRSGNSLYDAELLRRIDADRYATAAIDLLDCASSGPGSRYRLKGEIAFHGVSLPAQGTVKVESVLDGRLVITGEQVFDVRDFAIPSPTVLMLRIYPDVRVRLHAEAELEEVR
jgi:hypothetical protein